MPKEKETVKTNLLGEVGRPRVTGKFVVDQETAHAPLIQEGTVIRACCTGCGNCLELLPRGAKRVAKLANVSEPEIWEDHYFEAKRCPLCDKDYRDVALKAIGA